MATFVGNGGELNEEGYFRLLDDLLADGFASRTPTAWKVQQTGAGAMSVDVGEGAGLIEYGSTYGYPAWSDADETVAVAAADATNARKDIVVAYIDLDIIANNPKDGSEVNNPSALVFDIVAGTPAGSPADPSDGTIQTAVGAANPWIKLGRVNVAANATSIVTANIDDLRTSVSFRGKLLRSISSISVSETGSRADDVKLVNASGANRTYTLPDATLRAGTSIIVSKSDSSANRVTITPFGSQTINGSASATLSKQYSLVELVSDGTNWLVLRLVDTRTGDIFRCTTQTGLPGVNTWHDITGAETDVLYPIITQEIEVTGSCEFGTPTSNSNGQLRMLESVNGGAYGVVSNGDAVTFIAANSFAHTSLTVKRTMTVGNTYRYRPQAASSTGTGNANAGNATHVRYEKVTS